MWRILLAEVLGDLRAHRTRTLLTIFAMVWGTISIVLLLAFGQGLRNQVSTGLLNAGERVFMVYGGQTSLEHEGLSRGRRIRLREDDLDLVLRAIPEFEFGSPSYGRGRTHLEAGENRTTTYMEGVDPVFSELRRMFPALGGRFINQRDLEQRRRVLFLGDGIAARLFGDIQPVGETVLLDGLSFRVIGVMESKFQDSSNNGPDEDRAVIPASTFRSIYGNEFVNHLLVRPRNVADAPVAKQELYRVLGGRHRFDPTDERALSIWDFIEDEKIVGQIGFGIQVFLGLVGAFTLLVAGVGVANIMYVVVRERTREIGIKLAVGARRRHIVSQFLFEAILIAVGGGLLGLAVASLLVLGIDSIPSDNPAMEYILNPKLSVPIASTCVGMLMAIGLAAGILPARKAARLDPVESLRYE
ncbi:MAG: ABC transporter permease [Gemmatimonadetes bacterium]|nr:ABC transporter permease [Gemmatimonadota bacterium]MYC92763.1 ABC transporter permease [Gemmatimonadota bacterium]MYG35614.1 ABC transporter permease [Gemmatimonadota bacterium]MYJ17218.1 ABC transporter permease [Gemmatimonadota bacterium]